MKRIKGFVFLLMTVFLVTLCGSCNRNEQAEELVRCLNEHDEDGIMELLCEAVRTSEEIDFEQQFNDVFDLFGDRTINSYSLRGGGGQAHYEKGKKTWERIGITIYKVELSDESDEIKKIVYSKTSVDEENPSRVGLAWIKIITDEEEEYRIGEPKVN